MDKKQKQALLWFLWGAALLLALLAAFVPQPEGAVPASAPQSPGGYVWHISCPYCPCTI